MEVLIGNNQTWLENPGSEWRFLAGKIIDFSTVFQQAMVDYQRVNPGKDNWMVNMALFFQATKLNGQIDMVGSRISRIRYEYWRSI